ncbi:MAG: response regulator [Spirochaetota bacterium]
MAKLAVVDDDKKLIELLKHYLEENTHQVVAFTSPLEFQKQDPDSFDLVVLDILMPQVDGFEVLRGIRKNSSVPVIMLTARGDVYDRVVGLELGADDYLPKPFEPRELLARMEAVLRRARPEDKKHNRLDYSSFTLVPDSMKLIVQGSQVPLTSAEFELLYYFCINPFRVLTRDNIMENTRRIQWESFDRSVDVLVSRLRKKLKDNPQDPRIIRTIWGEGYMFIGRREE